MTTLRLIAEQPSIPATTAWYLADLAEARGKQALFTKQSPQRLKVLRERQSDLGEGKVLDATWCGWDRVFTVSFHRDRLCQVAWLVHIAATSHCDVICKQLQRNNR